MQAGDLIKVDYQIDVLGVATLTKQIYEVDSVNGADSTAKIASDLAALFWAAASDLIASTCSLSACKIVNLNRAEKAVVNPGLVGTGSAAATPSHQALRFNSYGHANDSDPLRRNANYISGIDEALTTRGRLNDRTKATPLETFLQSPQDTDTTGVILLPTIRWGGTPGPPTTWSYDQVDYTRVNPHIFSLRSRKFRTSI